MKKTNTTPTESAPETTPEITEVANIRITLIGSRIKVGKAICSGDVPFPVTKSQADALVASGLATITGVF